MKLSEEQRIKQVESEYEILGFPMEANIILSEKHSGILCYYFKRFENSTTNTIAVLDSLGTKKITYDVWRSDQGTLHHTEGPAYFCLFDSEYNYSPRSEYWVNGKKLTDFEIWSLFGKQQNDQTT